MLWLSVHTEENQSSHLNRTLVPVLIAGSQTSPAMNWPFITSEEINIPRF